MSPREDGLEGPLPIRATDIDQVNRVFSDAFTDRYHRDGLTGVRVPELNPAIWRYAIGVAGSGAMLWRDHDGVAAFNLIHHNGAEGWMGPLAVRPDRQGDGVGRTIVTAGIEHLKQHGARTIGLETMPRTIENIGFYSQLGFRPEYLTVSMSREGRHGGAGTAQLERASSLGPPSAWLEAAQGLVEQLQPGLDFRRELALTADQSLGDLTIVRRGEQWGGFALWHVTPLALGRPITELRILKLVAADQEAFRQLIAGVLVEARARQIDKVSVRCQTAFRTAYSDLMTMGFRVQWTDLRMVLDGFEERPLAAGIVFSNWEI